MSGPVGCILTLVLLPFVLLGIVVLLVVTFWKARRIRRAMAGRVAEVRDAAQTTPVAQFVQMFAADESFTRAEASQAAVPAAAGRTAAELLAEAERLGWIASRGGDLLAVTDEGRARSEDLLRARGL